MQYLLFSGEQKLSDLIHANYKLLSILPRFNIKLGFGDKQVKEVCESHCIPLNFFLMVCNVYTFDDYFPRKKDAVKIDIEALTSYLLSSHRYYTDDRIPVIKEQLRLLSECYNEKQSKLLKQFFDEYSKEVNSHLDYEESTVFPYIKELKQGVHSGNYSIDMFEKNHSNIEEKLHDLKNIIIKYLPDYGQPELRNQILFNLFWLEEDLNKHTLFENRILIPFVQQMEKKSL